MSLSILAAGEALPAQSAKAVVCIPLYGAHDLFVQCLSSVLAHSPPDVPIVVADDASPDTASLAWARELEAMGRLNHEVYWIQQAQNVGFVHNANNAFTATAPADAILLNSDCVVAEGWFEGLRDAAYADSLVATATALTNNGTIVSLPRRNQPMPGLPQDVTLEEAAARVRDRSLRLHPRIPAAVGHCIYIRRSALDLVGLFDEAFAPGYGEEVDFSQRCALQGLQHVVADDVFVLHHGRGSFGVDGERNPIQAEHEKIINSRYPYYAAMVLDAALDHHGTLARSLTVARQAIRGRTISIDGRCLTPFITGTQVHTLELISALYRTGEARIRVVAPDDLGDYARRTFDTMTGLEVISLSDVEEGVEADDVVHRPFQVGSPDDLPFLAKLGERLVVTNQDLIAYRNPGYFPSFSVWDGYRRLTGETMAVASIVLFFSRHAADDALADGLVTPDRIRVAYIGVDHGLAALHPDPVPPTAAAELAERPYLLCLGTDFRHKNRVFAMRLLEALQQRHGWAGRLVLAGPTVSCGSSAGDEAQWLALRPEVADAVVNLPAIAEGEKAWLYAHAAAVVYPTAYEGFGLIPFEAADAGVPCFFAHQASLAEVLPDASTVLTAWDPDESADRAIEVLSDPQRASALVEEVRRAASKLTWDRTARDLIAAYDDAVRLPAREAMRNLGMELTRDARYWTLRNQIGATGLSLVGPDDPLLSDDAQRTLAALVRRRTTRAVLLGALRAARLFARRREPERSALDAENDNVADRP